jgi:cell division protein FtsQ
LATSVVLAVGLVVWLGWFSPLLTATEVEIRGVTGARADSLERAASVSLGGPLLRVDADAVEQRIASDRQWRTVRVSRHLPHTVVIAVEPRIPAIAVPTGSGGVSIVDTEGVAFRTEASAPAGVPLVSGPSGDVPREGVTASLEALGALSPEIRKEVGAITLSSSGRVTLTLAHAGRARTVVWGGPGAAALKARLVEVLLSQPGATIDVSVPESPVTR